MPMGEDGYSNMPIGGAGGASDGPGDPGPVGDDGVRTPSGASGISEAGGGSGGSIGSKIGSGLANAGFGVAAVGVNAVRGTKDAASRMVNKVSMRAVLWGGKLAAASGGLMTAKAGAMVVGSAMVVAPISGVYGVGAFLGKDDSVKYEGFVERCEELTNEAKKGAGSGEGIDGDMEAYAQQIYSILSYAGMNDENIAGILGNFQVESGGNMDPTAVERIFDEPYEIGPRKQAMWDNDFNPQPTGIGLAQWTQGRTYMLLDYADKQGRDWHEIEVQMAFAMSEDTDAATFMEMVENKSPGSDDPGDAANFFLRKWERPADPNGNEPVRRKHASEWYAKMGGWEVDSKLGQSVLDMAEVAGSQADNKALQKELENCLSLTSNAGGNEDAAMAMASFSWPMYEDSKGNDGTDLYQWLRDEIFPGDLYYASCDRSVATAVRWSGTDDNFPKGAVSEQLKYVNGEGKDKWEKVSADAHEESNLEPGDVLITEGHILMYLSEDSIKEVYSEGEYTPDAAIAHGSLNDRSPGLDTFGGVQGDGRKFTAYRSKGPEKNSEYKDLKVPANLKPGKGDPNGPRTTPPG